MHKAAARNFQIALKLVLLLFITSNHNSIIAHMKIWIATAALFTLLTGAVGAQGIDFFHGTWPDAVAKAKAEGKLIFVDAYAEWCGPCKKMARTVFTDAKVGEYFNSNFIALKIDMEKEENAEFVGKYPVSAYPTLLFINAEGKIALKQVGAMEVEGLLGFGKKALASQNDGIDYETEYAEGKRDPEFLYKYVRWLNRNDKPSLKVTNEYLATQQDLTTPLNLRFILEGATEADSRVFGLLVKYRTQIAAAEGAAQVDRRMEQACKNTVRKAVEFKEMGLLQEAKQKMAELRPDKAEAFAYEADTRYYAAVKDAGAFLKSVRNYQKNTVKNNAVKLNELAVDITKAFPNDPKVLEQAAKWAEMAIDNGGLAEYHFTAARIYNRQGNKAKARAAAQKAKDLLNKDDYAVRMLIDEFLEML